MKKKMRCPFCPKQIPSQGVGFRSHVMSAHGESTYKEYMGQIDGGSHAEASPANHNGKHQGPSMQLNTECPHCGGALLILPAVIESGRINASIIPTPGLELRNRN